MKTKTTKKNTRIERAGARPVAYSRNRSPFPRTNGVVVHVSTPRDAERVVRSMKALGLTPFFHLGNEWVSKYSDFSWFDHNVGYAESRSTRITRNKGKLAVRVRGALYTYDSYRSTLTIVGR